MQYSERLPFTSEVAGPILRENFLSVTRTQCSTHVKRVCQHSAESRGLSGRSGFLPQGSWSVRRITDEEAKSQLL